MSDLNVASTEPEIVKYGELISEKVGKRVEFTNILHDPATDRFVRGILVDGKGVSINPDRPVLGQDASAQEVFDFLVESIIEATKNED